MYQKRKKQIFGLVLIIFLLGFKNLILAQALAYNTDAKIIAKGKAAFELNCGACHNFKQKGIGPNLGQISQEMPYIWIKNTIINLEKNKDKNADTRLRKLIAEYKQVMPVFEHLPAVDIENLMAYIHANRQNKSKIASNGLTGKLLPSPIKSKLSLRLTSVLTAPPSADKIPLSRINTMLVAPGSLKKTYLSDLRGMIYRFENKQLMPYFDFAKAVPAFIHTPGLATGLGSYAFHPDYEQNGLLYTSHTEKTDSKPADFKFADSIKTTLQWVITEWKLKDLNSATFEGTPREILRINMVSQIHGMQEIVFNPNAKKGEQDYGLLFVGLGDGGAAENGYPFICDSKSNIWSSVIRIDPSGNNSKNGQYGIPKTNPFVNTKGAAGEVYCRGFRNPNRIYWTADGKMLISDIGHKNIEELNLGKPGLDYGWPYREGTFKIDPSQNMDIVFKKSITDNFTYPILQYDHEEGNAFSAGYVYNTDDIKALKGKYIFGDVVTGKIYAVNNSELQLGKQASFQEFNLIIDGKKANFRDLCANTKTDLRIGQGSKGEFYFYTKTDGKMYEMVGVE